MKKFSTLILIAFIAMPAVMLAGNLKELFEAKSVDFEQKQDYRAVELSAVPNSLLNLINVTSKPDVVFLADSTPIIKISKIFNGQNWEMGQSSNYNFTYEPYSRTLFAVTCSRAGSGSDSTIPEGHIRKTGFLCYTVKEEGEPLGFSWKQSQLYDSVQPASSNTRDIHEWFYPTIAVTNPKKSDKFEDVYVGFNCAFLEYPYSDPSGAGAEKKKWFIYTNGKNILESVNATEYNDTEPGMNNDDGLIFERRCSLKGFGATINDKPYALFVSKAVNKNNDKAPHSYAFVGLDLSAPNANSCLNKTQLLPPSIMKNIFDDAIMTPDNNLNVPYTVDYDDKGNVYFAFCNPTHDRYTNPEGYENWKTLGIPLVIKAPYNDAQDAEIDFGTTPNVNQIPLKVILDYMVEHGGLPDTTDKETAPSFRYLATGARDMQFCVLGEDHYSFLLPFFFSIGQQQYAFQLVEVEYNKNKWTMRKIDTLDYVGFLDQNKKYRINPPFIYRTIKYKGKDALSLYSENLFYENQIARTVDNKYLVSKWINCNPKDIKTFDGLTPVDVYIPIIGGDTLIFTLDGIPQSKLWLSYRHVDSANWSKPVEACILDTINMFKTMMPKVISDITEVPITFWLSGQKADGQDKYPALIRYCFAAYAYNWLVISNAQTGFIQGVQEGETADEYHLGNAYPNPSSNIINFEFSLLAPAYTTLTINNALGQTVATVVDQFCNANEYKVDFNTSKLPNGTYYYTLTSGTKIETKMFNVIK